MKSKSGRLSHDRILGLAFLILVVVPASSGLAFSDPDCYKCHADEQSAVTKAGGDRIAAPQKVEGVAGEKSKHSPPVNRAHLEESAHRGLGCVGCHADIKSVPHPESLKPVLCSTCHEPEGAKYLGSVHGMAFSKGDPDVPTCAKCHGDHHVLPVDNPQSRVYPTNLIKVCIACHADEAIEARHDLPQQGLFRAYENSVHGRAIEEKGFVVAAACNDCHGSHEIKPVDDPGSLANKRNIPAVCGKCHTGIYDEYSGSIHGTAVASGIKEAPVCTDCHGEHTIAKVTDPQSKVYSRNIPTTCSACHDDREIVAEYKLAAKRYVTYLNSYHGVANKFGIPYVANCATCHGVHNIRPAGDPLSTINRENLPATCGKCHPGASRNFALGKVHVEATRENSIGVYAVREFYKWFIGVLVTCFALYAVLETVGKMRRKYAVQGK
ncbi:cytochrome c3 family protein [Candidatus Poribacteria bacterium]|nr:cytochrome c3 family protein [Candidatus Poribacteria bacterium]